MPAVRFVPHCERWRRNYQPSPIARDSTIVTSLVCQTDELGVHDAEDQVRLHDLQATILHLLGLDHLKLTFRFRGRDFRLTDVHGEVVKKLLA
jgi:hypothetical protein